MEKVWVLAEQRNGTPDALGLQLVAAARSFGSVVEAVTFGPGAEGVGAALGVHGVTKVLVVAELGDVLAAPSVAAAIADAIGRGEGPDVILIGATYDGRDVAARLSARIDRPVITNVVGLERDGDHLVSEHAVFGGTEIVKARFTGEGPAIFVVRAKSFVAEEVAGAPAEIATLPVPELGATNGARIVDRYVEERTGPSLDDAPVVVSGGRGLGGAEHYAVIEQLAALLHGAPGASRAIVDAGWVPYARQVGQTGKTVKPEVYIACGISGATQHIVGMKGAAHIIAINKDESAPLIQIADLSIVGDVHAVLPKLIEALQARS